MSISRKRLTGFATYGVVKQTEKVLGPFLFFYLGILACVGCKTIEFDDLGRYQNGGQLERRRDNGIQVRVLEVRLRNAAPNIHEIRRFKSPEHRETVLKKL